MLVRATMTSIPLNSSAVSNDVEGHLVRKLLLRLLPFLFLLYIVNYLDRINVGFAALQMRGQLGFSDDVFGTGFGIFFIGYFFLQVPSNLALSRVGARRWMAAIMVVWGLVSCCMIFVRTVHGFYAMRFVLGAAEAGFFPGIILYLKTWFPARGRARAVAWFMTANPLAGVVGGPISGALLNLHQFRLAGWQWMFIIEGVPAVLLSFVVLFTLKDQPNEAEWLLPQEKAWLVEILERERQQQAVMRRTDVAAAFLNWRVWLMTVVYFGLTASGYGLILWMPNYIKSLASSLGNFGIGVVSVIPYMATAAAMVVIGSRSDRTGKHRAFLAGSALSAAAFLFIAANMSSIVPGLAFVSLALMATFSMQGPFWATSTSLLGGTAAAAGIAVINSLGNLGGYFGPKIIGLSRTWGSGFRGGMLVISACLVLAGLVALMVRAQDGSSSSQRHPLQ
jgi:MFS transporter, ACS family, tartrate transporter